MTGSNPRECDGHGEFMLPITTRYALNRFKVAEMNHPFLSLSLFSLSAERRSLPGSTPFSDLLKTAHSKVNLSTLKVHHVNQRTLSVIVYP